MKKILVFVVLLEIFIAGEAGAASKIDELEIGILRENYSEIISKEDVLTGLYDFDLARAHYLLGLAYLKTGQFSKSRKHLSSALAISEDKALSESIELALADSYFTESEFNTALSYYEEFLNEYKGTGHKYIVKYKMSLACLKLGEWKEAKNLLEEVAASSSLEKEKAEKILKEGQFYFTVQVGSFQDRKNAVNLLKQLKKEKFNCFITEARCNKVVFYRIRVGKLKTRQEIEWLAAVLKKRGLPVRIYP